MRPGRPPLRLASTLALLLLVGCRMEPMPPDGIATPLFDGAHADEVLVEERRLAPPSAPGGNRFLLGWSPVGRGQDLRFVPRGASASLEVVRLSPGAATLELELEPETIATGARLRVVVNGGTEASHQPPELALTPNLRIPLPAGLPAGRQHLELHFAGTTAAPPTVIAAGVRTGSAAGAAGVVDGALCQSGASLVEVVRPVAAGTVLKGRFEPPAGGEGTFELRLSRGDGAETTIFRWPGENLGIEQALAGGEGFARMRFFADRPGPAGCWRDLALVAPRPPGAQAPTAPPSTSHAARPRLVLVYVMDALRADYLGHLGGPEGISPTLDRLAAGGATFTDHRSVAPNTLPATKALFTGQAVLQGGGRRLAADGAATLAERFRAAGYLTGLFSANEYVSSRFGMDRGFDHVEASTYFEHEAAAAFNDSAARVHRAALAWLAAQPVERPVFLYLHTLHPHNPYAPPPELARRFTAGIASAIDGGTRTLLAVAHGERPTTAADQARLKALYAAGVAYNDAELGGFLAALDRRVPATERLVVVTADHGEELFDHGGALHGYTLYPEMLQVPLVVSAPGRIAPRRIGARTDTLDVFPTLLELAGLEVPLQAEGHSLVPLLAGAAQPGKRLRFAAAASVKGGIFGVQSQRWELVWAPRTGRHWGLGSDGARSRDAWYLFDRLADPSAHHNLAGTRELEPAWLRARLLAWVAAGQARAEAGEETLDPESERRLRALGYVD